MNWRDDNLNAFDELALECIPKDYLNKDVDVYTNLLDVSCFIASLTDGLALEWYEKLSLSLIHISEPTRLLSIAFAGFWV